MVFHNDPDKTAAFEDLLTYVETYLRVKTHEGAIEITRLNWEIKSLKRDMKHMIWAPAKDD